MVIGLGIVLIVAGLILVLDVVNIDTTAVDLETLGWILLVAGVLAVLISLIINQQRTRSTQVVERRDGPPPL
jgi:TRAP-type C4-dicarboxylate transport system permease small subunit